MTTVAIIDYGSGNLRSAAKAFERTIREAGLPDQVVVSDDPHVILKADRIVLPGVGAFGDCKTGLSGLPGMLEVLDEAVIKGGKPFMGICVGMQLMAERGLEHGTHVGLGWIAGDVVALNPKNQTLKIPHMGWNVLDVKAPVHPVLADLPENAHAYFVHSYHFEVKTSTHCLASVEYGGQVTAAIGRDNLVGTQFHPEKSQAVGMKVISNFLKWKP